MKIIQTKRTNTKFSLLSFLLNKKLKKKEAKICQALADAFKQQDIERETMIQKKVTA